MDLNSDPDEPWAPSVDQGWPSRVERARDTTNLFDKNFSAVPPSSSGRKHKEKNHGQVSGADARRDGRQSGSKGSKSKSHKPHGERHRSGQ